jgi:hypothetical protein
VKAPIGAGTFNGSIGIICFYSTTIFETPCTKLLKATETDRNYCLSNCEATLVLVLVFAVLLPVLVKVFVVIVLLKIVVVARTGGAKYPKFGKSS